MLQRVNNYFSLLQDGAPKAIAPVSDCHIIYSTLFNFKSENISQTFSLKYVAKGVEKYRVNGKKYAVEPGKFLLVSKGSEVGSELKSQQQVEGFCYYLPEDMMRDVWGNLQKSSEKLLEDPRPASGLPVFLENVYDSRNCNLGRIISTFAAGCRRNLNNAQGLNREFFFHLGEAFCFHQNQHLKQLLRVPAHKKTTRDELYRRLLTTRDYIHDNYQRAISLPEMAQVASMSEFHFLRIFKATFGESPYQYLLQLRLQMSLAYLKDSRLPVCEIALLCGFNEVQAFTKLFRRQFHMGPTAYINRYFQKPVFI